uniref:N-acetyltransferase domain-containing protein n=1 Tax=Trypanosoma congolense (strain IL3000) TaxID=1068625 RepID=G0UNM1_TRYCI|nr:conserved hypothetical protein [Trypanosoma congolense IL3000]
MVECWKSEANFSVESSSIFLEEVDKRRSSTLHKVITNVLCEANLFPYPSQSSDKLSSVDLYVAAFSALPERGFTSQTFPNWEEWNDSDAKNFLVGVVGVAWTSLSPGCVVEGYLHVVWVRPEYRRRRIVQQLLRRTLSITEGGPLSHRVMRWRLHTMKSSAATNEYLLATLRNGVARAVSFKATDDGGFDAADGNAAYEEELKDVELLFSAVKRMYKEFGFCVRRYIYKYYAGKADAVEMIKNIPRTRKEC